MKHGRLNGGESIGGGSAMRVSGRGKLSLGVAAVAGVLVVGAALAETAASPLPAAVQRLLDCRATGADAARLSCYDAAVSDLGRLISSGDLVVVDHERVVAVKRQAFGFALPSLSLFERSDKAVELHQIAGTVARATQQSDGKWLIELEDGGVWQQTDNERLSRYPHKGSKAEIRKKSLGSYFLNLDGQRALRMRRVQ
jgi:hypothetical protein